jgi:cyanophycinase-like exopeptidase
MSQLVIMGSGETAPTMVPVHREVFAATPPGPVVMLDTTFGFQLNADELVSRTGRYFAESLGKTVDVATWRHRDDDALQREKSLALLAQATWAFAGPGSPTFALRQWVDTPVPAALADVVRRGGTLVMGSAAVVTLGV